MKTNNWPWELIAFLMVVAIIGTAAFKDVWGTVNAESVVTIVNNDCSCDYSILTKSIDNCGDVIGHGVTYDPRGARRSIDVWDCPDGLIIELTEYGEPTSNLDSTGPIIGETILPDEVVEWLQDEIGLNVIVQS